MRLTLALLLATLALGATPLAAEEEAGVAVTQDGPRIVLAAVGHKFSVPLPDWLSASERLSADVMGLVETNTYGDPRQAFVEFFPRGQSIENYTTTYGARVTLEPGRSLEDYRRATIVGYSQACKPEAVGAFTFGPDTPDTVSALGFVCGAFLDTTELRGQGQVMVSVYRKTDAGVAMVYQEWKGPAFNPADPLTWPVSADAYQARAAELQEQADLLQND